MMPRILLLLAVVLRATPLATGIRSAELVVTSNALSAPELRIPLTARRDSVGFVVLPAAADLGTLFHCEESRSTTLLIISTGTVETAASGAPPRGAG